ncbi:MAG: cell division protein FtsA, partial [Pseudomonadota bacterium]
LEGSAIALGSSMRGAIGVGPSQALDSDLRGYGAPAPTHRTPSRSDLVAVIRPRIEEILELARDRLEQAGFAYLPTRRAVLCGGAAQMPGVLETAQRVLGRDVRIGRPKQFRGLAPDFAGAPFAALTGLMVYAANPPEEVWDLSRPVRPRATSLSGRMWRWIRDSW